MCGSLILYLAYGSLVLLSPFPTDKTTQAQEGIRIAPASGGVELQQINIVRNTVLGASKDTDLTNMELKFWFAGRWKSEEKLSRYLIHLHALDPIEDDTGKLLLGDSRKQQIECLRGEVRGDDLMAFGGNEGPVVKLKLEAPARRADKIKAIKGKAEILRAKEVDITFRDLAAINGKELDHPKIKGLKSQKLSFSFEEKDGNLSARMTAPFNFASPWNFGRLEDWALVDGRKGIHLLSESTARGKVPNGVTVERTYDRRSSKGLSLRLIIVDPVESKTFNFDFRNVELP
jgi:hypothetical protein